jgi:hypothetical protein
MNHCFEIYFKFADRRKWSMATSPIRRKGAQLRVSLRLKRMLQKLSGADRPYRGPQLPEFRETGICSITFDATSFII